MIASMTAFARRDSAADWGAALWEIRTVNHRYLDISLRLPEGLRLLEASVRERITARLHRGKVDCLLRYEPAAGQDELCINTALARQLIQAAGRLGIPNPAAISGLDVLRWPGVLQARPPAVDALRVPVMQLLDETLDSITAARTREGDKLQRLVRQRCAACSSRVEQIRKNMPAIIAAIRERYVTRAQDMAQDTVLALDDARLEQELLLVCQRMDVAEELDRLAAHIAEIDRILGQDNDKPIGRRLDFLLQEMHREANTLGAKAAHLELSAASVDLRALIEQMREQIQNIE